MPFSRFDDKRDEPTRTESSKPEHHAEPHVFGVLWLTPEERFHELAHGAMFGRSADCTLALEGPSVSRQHARIEKGGPLWMLRDLESKNGVYINAERRELTPLAPQDTLRLGEWVGIVCWMPKAAATSGQYFDEPEPGMLLSAPTLSQISHYKSLAERDLPIVVRGQTGTGKEVLARALHRLSKRPGPLVAVNCAAIPEGLAEAELFGHQKGAFTGAIRSSVGHIASAHQGTLFLDEVVELSPALQSKLLRALEERAVTPVGSSQSISVDFRLLAAARDSLESRVAAGTFRSDLYARLNGAELELRPLCERRQEVPRLLRHALTSELGFAPHFDRLFVERVCCYRWPYNVRELFQLARLLAASPASDLGIERLPRRFYDPTVSVSEPDSASEGAAGLSARRKAWLDRNAAELVRLKQALSECGGNVFQASAKAGVPRHRARRLLAAEAELRAGADGATLLDPNTDD
jgi:transcriptional regulator of acetoin/glycerol metabolism